MLNKLKRFFLYFETEFFLAGAGFIFFVYFILRSPLDHIIALAAFLTFVLLFIFFARKRRNEIRKISSIINSITNNNYSSPDDVVLDSMPELEKDVKAMIRKYKTDISYLKKLEKMRTEFIGNVSHELRTPIFTIQGFLETILDGALNDKEVSRNFLEKAHKHTLNLSNLVNDLIDISMLETGEMRMSQRYFNLNEFIQSVIPEVHPLAEAKNLKLVYSPVRDNLQVFGDRTRLKQVMINLLTNAVKYTDAGTIEILAAEEGKSVRIAVKDTGIGINESEKERIFERLYRVDKARSKEAGGTGLGLSIVKHIIEAHNSKIEVKSTPNEGSEFYFLLKK